MRRVWRKVKSNSGASMLFALLVFMLCVLAGTAALTAAAANSGRYTHMEAEQQDYLSVASAARVVKKELVDGNFTAAFSAEQRVQAGAATPPLPVVTNSVLSFTHGGEPSVFSNVFSDYFTYLYLKHAREGLTGPFITSLEGSFSTSITSDTFTPRTFTISGIEGINDVKMEMKAEGFTIKVTLYTGKDTEPRNKTVIELVGDPTWTEDTKSENYYYVITPATPGTTATYGVGTKTTVVRNLSVKWTLENATVYDGGRKE